MMRLNLSINLRIIMRIIKFLVFIIVLLFYHSSNAQASTTINLFQITTDGSQQKDPFIYKNSVVYNSYGDIWGYDLETKENFPILEKEGEQYLTSFYKNSEKNMIVYEDVNDSNLDYDVRLYNVITHEDVLIAGGFGSQTGGVTNGKVIVYINGGACGSLHIYNIRKKTTKQIENFTCSPLRISGDILVYPIADPQGTNIKGHNTNTGEFFDVIIEEGFQESADTSKNKVVWVHYTTGALGDYNAIKLKDLETGEIKTIYESTSTTLQAPAISNRYIVWSESSAQHVNGIKGYDLKRGEVFEVQPQGSHQNSHTIPAIYDNTAVWMSFRTGNGDIYGAKFRNI